MNSGEPRAAFQHPFDLPEAYQSANPQPPLLPDVFGRNLQSVRIAAGDETRVLNRIPIAAFAHPFRSAGIKVKDGWCLGRSCKQTPSHLVNAFCGEDGISRRLLCGFIADLHVGFLKLGPSSLVSYGDTALGLFGAFAICACGVAFRKH